LRVFSPGRSRSRVALDFHVKDSLPNQTFPLTRSFAGNIPVNREGHPNDTLFFWAFEKSNGSLTRAPKGGDDDPWMIWLNGGQFRRKRN
jgi:carboxypeptidase D